MKQVNENITGSDMKKLKFLLAAGFAFFMLSMAENKKTGERRTCKML